MIDVVKLFAGPQHQYVVHVTHNILITAYPEPNRLERLRRFLESISSTKTLENILQVHDHKGDLSVTWERMDESDARIVDVAWLREGEPNVEHICDGKRYHWRLSPEQSGAA